MSAKLFQGPPTTVAEQFESAHEDFAELRGLLCNDTWWTFSEIKSASLGAVGLLAKEGARSGDRIVLFLENSAVLRILEHGILSTGLVRVALSPRLHAREVSTIAEDCTAAIICCSPQHEAALREALADVGSKRKVIVFSDTAGVTPEKLATMPPPAPNIFTPPEPADIAMLMYSSGTTGQPKGAIVTHRAWIAQTELALAQLPQIGPGDVVLAVAPMPHFGGSIGLNCAARGAATIPVESFDAENTLELIIKHGVTVLPLAPVILKSLASEALQELQHHAMKTLRAIPYGGSPTDVLTLVHSAFIFPGCLVQYYGLAETLAPVSSLSAADHDAASAVILAGEDQGGHAQRVLESAGQPSAGVELRFATSGGGESDVLEHIGEIVVRSPMVTTGYWNRPELTAASLDGDGWFSTGDLGELDADGYLHLLNRKNDMIISGGYNIYPGEVEKVLRSLSGIEECAIIGIPHPRWGETVHALIVITHEGRYDGDPALALPQLTHDVLDACRKTLAGFKKPTSIEIISVIPRTSAGKVDRKQLLLGYHKRHTNDTGSAEFKLPKN